MKSSKTVSVEELQIISRFENLRRILLSDPYAEHLDRPLAFWALPTDRRLPLAFLSRTLRDLLGASFAELAATPGIGQKKIRSFVTLLARAANTDPADLPLDLGRIAMAGENGDAPASASESGHAAAGASDATADPEGFDPSNVSEVVWGRWRASVLKHGLGHEKLGRFAPTLLNMTRVIWNTSLVAYTDRTLAEIRAMKTHGEKRVRAILEVFHGVHTLVANMGTRDHLVVRIVPRRIDAVENWIDRVLQNPGVPSDAEIFENFVGPLLEQVRNDASQQIASLAENRLGVNGPISSVRQAARTMGLTRARVYQLLNEINDIMNVRWPSGRHQVYELSDKFQAEIPNVAEPPSLNQFRAAVELFYPGSRRGAAGPLEHAALGDADGISAHEADVEEFDERNSAELDEDESELEPSDVSESLSEELDLNSEEEPQLAMGAE